MRKYLMFLFFAVAPLALAGKWEPIYTGEVGYNKSLTGKAVEKGIKKALLARGWSVKKVEAGVVHAHLSVRSHRVDIKITHGDGLIQMIYVKSNNLSKQKKGKTLVHRNYNRWIRILERDIQIQLIE